VMLRLSCDDRGGMRCLNVDQMFVPSFGRLSSWEEQ
jgi:hypothetical protein